MKITKNSTMKSKLIMAVLILSGFLILSSNVVVPICPKADYTPDELRAHIRSIVLDFLSSPASDPYTVNEILDLLAFYNQEKDSLLIANCDLIGSNTAEPISTIMKKTILFPTECNNGIDDDGDGAVDLSDAGCADAADEDETNCGDNVCEGSENFLSCSLDCGASLLLMKGINNAISFSDKGNAVLKGTLQKGTSPVSTSDNEFIFKNSAGNPVAIINLVTGNMAIKGSLFEKQSSLTPSAGHDFIIEDANGNIVSYIDESGNFYLKGTLTQNGNP